MDPPIREILQAEGIHTIRTCRSATLQDKTSSFTFTVDKEPLRKFGVLEDDVLVADTIEAEQEFYMTPEEIVVAYRFPRPDQWPEENRPTRLASGVGRRGGAD